MFYNIGFWWQKLEAHLYLLPADFNPFILIYIGHLDTWVEPFKCSTLIAGPANIRLTRNYLKLTKDTSLLYLQLKVL